MGRTLAKSTHDKNVSKFQFVSCAYVYVFSVVKSILRKALNFDIACFCFAGCKEMNLNVACVCSFIKYADLKRFRP